MATTTNTKASATDLATSLAAGTTKHIPASSVLLVGGGSFTADQVLGKLLAFSKLRVDVEAAKAAVQAKLATERSDGPTLRTFVDAYATFVKAAYGTSPDVLADFGLRPKKVPPRRRPKPRRRPPRSAPPHARRVTSWARSSGRRSSVMSSALPSRPSPLLRRSRRR